MGLCSECCRLLFSLRSRSVHSLPVEPPSRPSTRGVRGGTPAVFCLWSSTWLVPRICREGCSKGPSSNTCVGASPHQRTVLGHLLCPSIQPSSHGVLGTHSGSPGEGPNPAARLMNWLPIRGPPTPPGAQLMSENLSQDSRKPITSQITCLSPRVSEGTNQQRMTRDSVRSWTQELLSLRSLGSRTVDVEAP